MGFEGSEALADRTCFAKDFILQKISLGLKFRTHLSAESSHFGTESGELSSERSYLCMASFNLRLKGLDRKFRIFLAPIHLHGECLEIGDEDVLEDVANLCDDVLSHAAIVR